MTEPAAMPSTNQSNPRAAGSTAGAAALLSLAALAWAGNYVMGRAIAGEVPPVGLAVGRWAVAVLVLLPLARPHLAKDGPVLAAHWRYVAVMGFAGAALFGTLQYAALWTTTATNGGLLSATSPVLIGLAISLAGALVIVTRGDLANLAHLRLDIGDVMLLVSLVAWAVYSALLRLKPKLHWTSFTLAVFAVGLAANLPMLAVEHALGYPLRPTLATAGAVLYTGVIASVVGFAAWNRGVEIIGSQRAGVFLNLIPVLTVALSIGLLGERPRPYHGVACVLILAGLVLAMRKERAA